MVTMSTVGLSAGRRRPPVSGVAVAPDWLLVGKGCQDGFERGAVGAELCHDASYSAFAFGRESDVDDASVGFG